MTKSARHRAENERIFRSRNDRSSHLAAAVLDDDSRKDYKLSFVCECSDEHCQQNVELTLKDYQQIRHYKKRFILVPGHEQTDIEAVVSEAAYLVVEKYAAPPPTDGRLNQTHS